jgi:hypothetical protein
VSFAVLLLLGLGSCAVEQGKVYTVDGKPYCIASGIWRNKWWQNYERGLSCAEGKFWDEAMASFRAALAVSRGQKDRWRVNTYGVRFIDDYFPHRELGIVYYQLGRYEEARRELELSLGMTETAKAKFYLNKVRRTLLQTTQRDTTPPRIIIASPPDDFLTKDLSVAVLGHAEADTYVESLVINGREQFVELAEPRLPFKQEIALQDGVNTIDIAATDLFGRQTRRRVLVHLDRHGPSLSLQQVELSGVPPQWVRLQGFLSDRSPIKRFVLAGRDVRLPPGAAGAFHEEVAIPPGTPSLYFEAEDAAGNVTRGEIALGQFASQPPGIRQGKLTPPGMPQWASLPPHLVVSDLVASSQASPPIGRRRGRDSTPPVIELTSSNLAGGEGSCRTKGRTVVAENSVLLEIKVTDESEVTRVALDGQPLPHPRGVQLFFTEIVPLQLETDNGFVLEAVDEWGNMTQCEIFVKHEVRKARRMTYRLKVLQAPFEIKDRCESTALVAAAEEYFFGALNGRKRFNISKTTQKIGEKKSSEADGVIKATACQDKAADGTPSLLVFADFIDADTDESETTDEDRIREDVYGEGLDQRNVKKLMEGLSLKILQHFPLVEGSVSERKGKRFLTSLTRAQNIRSNMRLIVFREEGSSEMQAQKDGQEILGEARVIGVHDKFSEAALIKPGTSDIVQPKDKVVTK